MTAIEIVLIIAGLVLMAGSFFVTEKLSPDELNKIAELSQEEIAHIVDREIEASHDKVREQLETEMEEVLALFDRASDKETNEKIMAISEYSDTVIESINKSHNEIMFLYSMLGDKHKEVIDFSNDLQERVERFQRLATDEMLNEAVMKEERMEAIRSSAEAAAAAAAATAAAAPKAAEEVLEAGPAVEPEEEPIPQAASEEEAQGEKSSNEKILELHAQGLSDENVAKELGIGLGIVKLVIKLHKKEGPSA